MRILIAVPALLVLGACNVTKDGNAVTVQYDQNTAENTAADIGNSAQNIAADIGNDVAKTGDKIQNTVGNADVSVKVGKDDDSKDTTKTTTTTTTTENKSK
jgi:predicted small secreted protein